MNEWRKDWGPNDPAIQDLKSRVHERARQDLEVRLKSNPIPTEQEIVMGAFQEMLEPQVREALDIMYRKGYSTGSSGFAGGRWQMIDGFFTITPEAETNIKELGARVRRFDNGYTFIEFEVENPDLDAITQKWIKIAEFLPDTGKPASMAMSVGADKFRTEHADPETVKRIEKKLTAQK